jgi:hypothetical protein
MKFAGAWLLLASLSSLASARPVLVEESATLASSKAATLFDDYLACQP